jgi:glycosyltransferase involved in cell wall biosynthesis
LNEIPKNRLNKRSLLFYGELPPNAVHGIAYANLVNLNQLKDYYDVDIVEERSKLSEHYLLLLKKASRLIKDQFCIILNSIKKRYDYFYLTFSLSSLGCVKTLLAILSFRIFNSGKVILHIHRGDFLKWFMKKSFTRIMARLVIKFSSKIIVLSEIQKVEFNQIFNKSCFILHNTVENEYNHVLVEKRNNRFIFISNYLFEKGIFDLLEVFSNLAKKYPNIFLYTYGAFPNQNIKKRILEFASPNIIINDLIIGREKFIEIEKADCLVLPSLNEGEPIVLLEAMSVGTPIISTRVGLIPELLGDDYPFLSLPGDKVSLEEKIIQFINHKNLISIAINLENRYISKYSHKIHSENLFAIFI